MFEAAIMLPIFFLLIYGCVQFSLIFFTYSNAFYAGQVALRYARMHSNQSPTPCTNATLTSIITPLLWGVPASAVTVTTTWGPSNVVRSYITINISIAFKTAIPFSSLRTVPIGVKAFGTVMY